VEFDANGGQSGLSTAIFVPIEELQRHFRSDAKPHVMSLDLLWHLTLFFRVNRCHVLTGKDICTQCVKVSIALLLLLTCCH